MQDSGEIWIGILLGCGHGYGCWLSFLQDTSKEKQEYTNNSRNWPEGVRKKSKISFSPVSYLLACSSCVGRLLYEYFASACTTQAS